MRYDKQELFLKNITYCPLDNTVMYLKEAIFSQHVLNKQALYGIWHYTDKRFFEE